MSITINTNLSSLLVQNSLKNSTMSLNQAIERMTTGFKINSAKDDAANYAISIKMSSKISSYEVAKDNVAMGLDMLSTAGNSLSIIEKSLTRLRELAVQASNDTYGDDSRRAINSEVNAIIDEIERTYESTEYNGIKVFQSGSPQDNAPTININELSDFASVASDTIITISDEAGLRKLSDMVNAGMNTAGKKFRLANDITLTQAFTPIGYYDSSNDIYRFYGEFDGNGYTIKNMTINATRSYAGLFGLLSGATVKNLNIDNATINTSYANAGIITGSANYSSVIENCNVKGNINGTTNSSCNTMGGLVSFMGNNSVINNCSFEGKIKAYNVVGGIAASVQSGSTVKNSYANSQITVSNHHNGGITGITNNATIENCYSIGSITGGAKLGGIIGSTAGSIATNVNNCYSDMSITNNVTGAIVGEVGAPVNITNCYSSRQSLAYGRLNGGSANVVNSYFSTSNLISASTFAAWASEVNDFGDPLWVITDGQKPTLNTGYSAPIPGTSTPSGTGSSGTSQVINLQVGIDSSQYSTLILDLQYLLEDLDELRGIGDGNNRYIAKIDELLKDASSKQTIIGATENRLLSILDEIGVQYTNLISSRSTIKDADISTESSRFIKSQILQQASATLLATANQTPSIALQLI